MTGIYLVELETTGNQTHIFGSNRRRENLGASEQILRITTEELVRFVSGIQKPFADANFAEDLASWQADPAQNPPIENGGDYEVILATSGKATVLAQGRDEAVALVSAMSLIALEKMPGLGLVGAVSPAAVDLDTAASLHQARQATLQRLGALSASLTPPLGRFARLPFSAECRSTGEPAAGFDACDPPLKKERKLYPYGAAALGRRTYMPAARKRLNAAFDGRLLWDSELDADGRPAPPAELRWWGVIHADGNGLGNFFFGFDKAVAPTLGATGATGRDYIDTLRAFSTALDACTQKSAREAMNAVWPGRPNDEAVDLKPLIIAGDDLTILTDGRRAVEFAAEYLAAFERNTIADRVLGPILQRAAGADLIPSPGLFAAAGVAVVKAHHPFHRAYELAEALCSSAKVCKKLPGPTSALDFHIAGDLASDLAAIRESLVPSGPGPARNWGGPYALDAKQGLADDALKYPAQGSTAALRRYSGLSLSRCTMADLCQPDSDGDIRLGKAALHELRTALFRSAAAVDVVAGRLARRKGFADWKHDLFDGDGPRDAASGGSTVLLDAMELGAVRSAEY